MLARRGICCFGFSFERLPVGPLCKIRNFSAFHGFYVFSPAFVGGRIVIPDDPADYSAAFDRIAQKPAARCDVPTMGSRATHGGESFVEDAGRRCDCTVRRGSHLDDLGSNESYSETSRLSCLHIAVL